ncbi:MAG TPA: holo-ACP synthase [Solirubrobacteraceae bacterium]|jgi:holo-[acyl-carrier protein] synthase|nr:holo-ACP synthase [Solirubrobacteraceae bacterium]
MPDSVGIDMVDVDEVREALAAHGERYLERVYTPQERVACGRNPRLLAARFAAKEATMKALACEDRLPWHSIAVATDLNDAPTLALSGPAAEMARARGINSVALSLTHGASYAAAIVLTEAS